MSHKVKELEESFEKAKSAGNESLFLSALERSSGSDINKLLDTNPALFFETCAAGFFSSAEMLLYNGANLDSEFGGLTAVQQAAVAGNASVVRFLLDKGATVSKEVWHEDSPFFTAAVCGYNDVFTELLSYYSSFLKDMESRICLLYAACKGGNAAIVKCLYLPHMDVNSPVPLITTFENCENLVPLYAACEGNQAEIAKFLVEECGAIITRSIAKRFPRITAMLFKRCFKQVGDQAYEAQMRNSKLTLLQAVWFEPYLTTLTSVDVSKNRLKTLDPVLPWQMPNLLYFCASHNKLQKFEGPDEECECTMLEEIDLSCNDLDEVCPELFSLPSLSVLNLSSNKLEYLVKTSYVTPELNWTGQSTNRRRTSSGRKTEWNLLCLTKLDVSHNSLKRIPEELRTCPVVEHINASDNELYSFISPWSCPLTFLNLNDNNLERFPASAEDFWHESLVDLHLQNNNLEEIGETIVKLGLLRGVDLSNNKIEYLPDPSLWECRFLEMLDLANNNLGRPMSIEEINQRAMVSSKGLKSVIRNFGRRFSGLDADQTKELVFPKLLYLSLKHLILRNNNLDHVPQSISQLQNLTKLDISQNPLIRTLPKELGLLTRCKEVTLSGMKIVDVPESLTTDPCSLGLLGHLRKKLRNCEPNQRLKLIVLGPQGKGKTTLLSLLQGTAPYEHGNKIYKTDWRLTSKNVYQTLLSSNKPDIVFNVWELPGHRDLAMVHQCFLTQNALYVLVFDLKTDLEELQEWLCQIQTSVARAHLQQGSAPRASLILVGTFYDKLNPRQREVRIQELREGLTKMTSQDFCPNIMILKPISCITKDGVQDLKICLYKLGLETINVHAYPDTFIGMNVPKSYIRLVDAVNRKRNELERLTQPPYLTEQDFYNLLEEDKESDLLQLDDVGNALEYLLEVGALLHFNEQLHGLNSLYFLDPVWLQELLALVVMDTAKVSSSNIPISLLQKKFEDNGFQAHLFSQYIQLLKRFEIVVETDGGRSLLVPSKLPREKPMIRADISEDNKAHKLYRLYKLPYIPPLFWSHFIVRLLKATERFSHKWFLNTRKTRPASPKQLSYRPSSVGYTMKNKDIVYWREGIKVAHEVGYFMAESCSYTIPDSKDLGTGILITIVSRTDRGLSSMGIIVDELDDILREYFTDFQNFGVELPRVIAVCPCCYPHVKDEYGVVVDVDHFDVQTCALAALSGTKINCPSGFMINLENLAPELLFRELPKRFFLESKEVKVSDLKVGTGATGAVFTGKFGETDIALKMFYHIREIKKYSGNDSVDSGSSTMSTHENDDIPIYGNVGIKKPSSDYDEEHSIKAYKAFSEFRKEVAVLSKLRHPCIVSFLGVSLQPSLYIVMELAQHGSLRSVLDKELSAGGSKSGSKKSKSSSTVFSRDTTFKILHQIAKGLEYLHENSITYRDLKSDNVLVCSLDIDTVQNVKLSDYGISRFATSQGLQGLHGTLGYMAPEIMNRQTYTEKVDIFSFSMLIHEVLSGHRPYEEYSIPVHVMQACVKRKERPSLKNYRIRPHFPYLEHLMSVCWKHDASRRPSAESITQYMQNHQILAQYDVISPGEDLLFSEVACMASLCEETESNAKIHQVWIWEKKQEDKERCYSIFNLDTSTFHVLQKPCSGSSVCCMLKVGKNVWVGTEGREIEIFGCSSTGLPSCKATFPLDALPVSIVQHQPEDDGGTEHMGHVFVGLVNGAVGIFVHQPNMRKLNKEWRFVKSLTLCLDHPLCEMTLVNSTCELWVGCGPLISIVSTETLLKEDLIDIKKNAVCRKLGKKPVIKHLISAGDRVWCSFQKSGKIFEFDAHSRQILFCLDMACNHRAWKCLVLNKEAISGSDTELETDPEDDDDSKAPPRPPSFRITTRRQAPVPPVSGEVEHGFYDAPYAQQVVDAEHVVSAEEHACSNAEEHAYLELLNDSPEQKSRDSGDLQEYEEVDFKGPSIEYVQDKSNIFRKMSKQIKDNLTTISRELSVHETRRCKSSSESNEACSSPPPIPPRNSLRSSFSPSLRPDSRKSTTSEIQSPSFVSHIAPLLPPKSVGNAEETAPRVPVRTKKQPPPVSPKPVRKHQPVSLNSSSSARMLTVPGCDDAAPPPPPPKPGKARTLHNSQKPKIDTDLPKSQTNPTVDSPPPVPPRSPNLPPRFKESHIKLRKESTPVYVSSLLVKDDQLWIGTSSGTVVLASIKGDSSKTRQKWTVLKRVSANWLDGRESRTGPVTQLVTVGNLVLSSVNLISVEIPQTEISVWDVAGSNRLDVISSFWKGLSRMQQDLANRNSLDAV